MSQPVELEALAKQIAEFGERAFLVTVSDDEQPHVVSVVVAFDGRLLHMGTGQRTRRNLERALPVTVMWPAVGDGAYGLIVDGAYDGPDESDDVTIRPSSAILHRIAGAAGDGPNCVRLEEA